MLQSKAQKRYVSATDDLLEFEANYSAAEILRRLSNCKALISHEARCIYDEWINARKSGDTDLTLSEWMQGKRIAIIGKNQMLQVERAGQLVDVMPSDLAELVPYGGFGYEFTVIRDNDIIKISSVTDKLIHH